MIKSLIVLGGGNAGLMTALYLRSSYPQLPITVIKSTKIGTIGVGEGSTEHWDIFSKATGIPNWEIIQEAGATLKAGIKFENWHGDGSCYYHSVPEFFAVTEAYSGLPHVMLNEIVNGRGTEELHWDLAMSGYHAEPLADNFFQFHFDSERLNALFLKKCSERNIIVVEAEIVDATLDQDGFVESVVDTDNQKYTADFFVDSSGFKRVISSKLGSQWTDWSEYLPMNSAIAFPTPYQEEIPPWTLSKALTSGWCWRSPVQHRFGNGYVFSDSFITEQQAIDEIQKDFKDPINIARKVNFVSGKIDRFWIKNCVSVGLSSSFVEPLEASSISTTVQQARLLTVSLSTWTRDDTSTPKHYNKQFDEVMSNILDFIQLHYLTERTDSEFWRWCKHDLKLTNFNAEHIPLFKKNFINQMSLPTNTYNLYDILNWVQVMHGLRMFDVSSLKELHKSMHSHTVKEAAHIMSTIPGINDDTYYSPREAVNIVKARGDGRIQL
jgi:tryptophan halogenase